MESLQSFFEALKNQEKPFVIYRKPGKTTVKAILQNDNSLHYVDDFQEEGFVFAPFDTNQKVILFPKNSVTSHKFQAIPNIEEVSVKEGRTVSNTGKDAHIHLVAQGIKAIKEGEMKKVVLSRKHIEPLTSRNIQEVFVRLLSTYKTALVYCWFHPKVGMWLGASPETLLTVKNRQLSTMALAGTMPFKGNLDVTWGEKEKEEQDFVTRAIVDNLSPLLENNLEIKGPYTSQAGSLVHLKTDITVSLTNEKTDLKKIITALHPTPAICGLPKEAARSFILENEGYDRAYYTGYLGELNNTDVVNRSRSRRNVENRAYTLVKKTTSLYVNLRCMQWSGDKATIYVGGGVTAGSSPEKEWEETVNKLQTMRTIL